MGTRADFYIGRGSDAEWIGSIAYDGDPEGQPRAVFGAKTKKSYRAKVSKLLSSLDDATLPEQGWPWPWDDSGTSDAAYAWDDKQLWICYGDGWINENQHIAIQEATQILEKAGLETDWLPERWVEEDPDFPDMSERKNVTLGPRSGMMFIG